MFNYFINVSGNANQVCCEEVRLKVYNDVTRSHETNLNSRLADKRYQRNIHWGSIWEILLLLQKCILETLNYYVVVKCLSINDFKVLKNGL